MTTFFQFNDTANTQTFKIKTEPQDIGHRGKMTVFSSGAGTNQSFIFGEYVSPVCSIHITETNQSIIEASSFNTLSDYRLKSNVETLDNTYTIDNIRPVQYCLTPPHSNCINAYNNVEQTDNNTMNEGSKTFGVIAHELAEVYPDLVTGEKDGTIMQTVNYTGLIPILINEIKMLKQRVKKLELEKREQEYNKVD
jgi:hypothetical protein